jgi:hypothetical protein
MTDAPDELVAPDEAAEALGVTPAQVDVMVEQGLLTPAGPGEPRFARAEVEALRLAGG